MPDARVLIVLGVVAAAAVLFVVLRPGGEEAAAPAPPGTELAETEPETSPEEAATAPEEAETAPAETVEEEAPEEPEPQPAPAPAPTMTIVIRNGLPDGGIQRATVRQDEDVWILVRSDARDELHLHGYDLVRDVGPGAPAQMRFRATVPGRFELETHQRHVIIAELEVRP